MNPRTLSRTTTGRAPASPPVLLRRLAALVGLVGLVACSSTGTGVSAKGEPIRVTLQDYRGSQKLELVSESHTDRIQTYSQVKQDASMKVQTDDVMRALVKEIDRNGLAEYGQAGSGPSRGSTVVTRGLEVDEDGHLRHWIVGPGTAAVEKKAFLEAMSNFVQIYNLTQAFQAVENRSGTQVFQAVGGGSAGGGGGGRPRT